MKTLTVTLFLGFFSQSILADIPDLKCKVQNPCAFKADIGYCLSSSFPIRTDYVNGRYEKAAVVTIQNVSFNDFLRTAAIIPVSESISEGYKYISGSADEGDSQITLYPQGLKNSSSIYDGKLILEEDFEFSVSCSVN